MEINYNVSGKDRKALVQKIGELTGGYVKYLGAPTFAYQIGNYILGKNGELTFDDLGNNNDVELLVERLGEAGFEAEACGADFVDDDEINLVMSIPRAGVSDEAIVNLRKLVEGKAALIMKALGADSLEIAVYEDWIQFPWFSRQLDPDESMAFATFISKLVDMAKTLKRVNSTSKDSYNEKYQFRCFLLRLGFIGKVYKNEREVLLRNLSGNSAFSGRKPKTRMIEVW